MTGFSYREIFDRLSDAVIVADATNRIIYANRPRQASLAGLTKGLWGGI